MKQREEQDSRKQNTPNRAASRISMMSRVLALFCVLAMSMTAMKAQTVDSQQISGTITDASGAAVPDAEVSVTNSATGLTKKVASDASGNYVVLDIPIGSYNVRASAKGFKAALVQGVQVDVGSKPSIPLTLLIGERDETVSVEADSVLIQTTSAEVGSVVTSEQATQIQLNGRNYVQLIALSPGVSQTVASAFTGLFGTYGVAGNGQSVDGMRPDNSNFFLDGVDNKDNGGSGNNFVNISPDALEEFRTAGSAYDASYGGTAGATVSVAIKNGTRDFHGLAYEFLRNKDIQAYPFVPIGSAPAKLPFVYNDFGWTLGGPVFIPGHLNSNRDKLFFFAGQEYKRLRQFIQTPDTVPSDAEKTGDLTALGGPVIPQCGGNVTTGCATPTGLALAQLFPHANGGTAASPTFSFPAQNYFNSSEYLVKIDYNMNEKNQISGHFVHDYYTTPGTPTQAIVFDREVPGFTSSAQWTHTFNPRTANTLTASYSGNRVTENTGIGPNPYFNNLKGITRASNNLNYATLYNASPDIPTLSVSGYTTVTATALNFNNSERVYALKDDFSHVIGHHSLKAGIYAWRNRKNQNSIPAINGTFGFTGSTKIAALTNLLEGNFATYQEANAIQQTWTRFTQIESYAQDDWTVNRRLVLNLGLRYQYMEPIYSALYNGSAFYPSYYDPTHAATVNNAGIITSNPYPYNGLVLGGNGFPPQAQSRVALASNPAVQALFHNLPAGLVDTYYDTPAPRVGFSYDVTGQQKTVVHAGFGLSYERVEGNYYINSVAQLPFVSVSNLLSGNADTIASAAPASANPTTIGYSRTRNLEPPRVKNWSMGVQQRLSSDTMAEVNYVGSSSANLTYYQNINQEAAGTRQAHPGVSVNALRPYLGYADIFQSANGGISNYNSLQARILKQMRHGGTVSVSYTWSKDLTDAFYYNYNPQDSTNIRADYGPANYNTPQILVVSYVYPLPFWQSGQEWYKRAFGKFQVSGITRFSSGLPINVTEPSSTDTAGDGVTSVSQRPNQVGNYFTGAHTEKQWISPSAFATPPAGTFGTFEAFGVPGPRYDNWDVSLQKTFPIHEQLGVDFRAELFNVANHFSAFSINNTLLNSNFGQTSGATDPRTAEFALKLHF